MKSSFLLFLALTAIAPIFAQLKIFEKSPGFSTALQSILLDFPNNFRNISGELVEAQGEYEKYESTVKIPGAESCLIGRYHSIKDSTASVQALMYRTETFESAASRYKKIFKELKSSQISVVDGSKLFLEGEMEAPREEMDFTVSTLVFGTPDYRYKDFKVELELLYKIDGWEINLNIISRQRDSEMRPDWMETRTTR